ncbi:MAG TPA: hypothetical protein VN648_21980 [Candidatus Methylomirabilis sp.]|nr:hypothetical protein [Candidatus Methylomirabilis sp.]
MEMQQVPGGGGTQNYSWVILDSKCNCHVSPISHQVVHQFWEAEEARPFHDETLMEATKTINRLLASAAEKSPESERELCFIEFLNRPFLAWSKTERGALTADDDPATVARALGLRYEPSSPSTD